MRKFSLTTETIRGQILFTYNEAGFLVGINVEGDFTERAIMWFFHTAPFTIERLMAIPLRNKTITEVV